MEKTEGAIALMLNANYNDRRAIQSHQRTGFARDMQTDRTKLSRKSKNPSAFLLRGFLNKSLTMTYFHTGCSTIIGAKSFHGPVRDGKGWYQLAMVIRHNL